MLCVGVLFFIHRILNIKSTNSLHPLSSAVLLNLPCGNFRNRNGYFTPACLNYCRTFGSFYSNESGKYQGSALIYL
jgi:hypothetical protein